MTLYGAAKAPGAELREAGTTVAALTDDSTGTVSETIAAATNTATLTNSVGGTANDTLAVATNIATVTDSSGGTAGSDVKDIPDGGTGDAAGAWESASVRNAAIVIINDNFKDLMAANIVQKTLNTSMTNTLTTIGRELIAQKALNTVYVNAIASLANKQSDLITHLNDGR